MKWEPKDIIRLVALFGALLVFALGALMMWMGISAEGAINIKSTILSGSIKTGSAGLFIAFLAFVIMALVLLSLRMQPSGEPHQFKPISNKSKSQRILPVLWCILIALVISGGLGALGYGDGFGALAFFLGMLLVLVGAAYLTFLDNE